MALAACQGYGALAPSQSTVATAAPRRPSTRPSAFFASEVHASCSSTAFSEGRSALNVESRPRIATRRTQPSFVVRGLFGLGVPELAVIAGVAALLFGPKQLPQIGKKLGQTVTSFQQAAKEFETEVKKDSGEAQENDVKLEEPRRTESVTPSKPEDSSS
ncbi:sec-independent protein translocase protein TATA, chloroplastic [Physcomitrium patens]|uniref:Chloroplast Tha4-2 n=1 Tax=Physcomitrium patens TaxID=3218 RepID=Q6RJN4_PHYPA|nr:sec-independent protein translocase protein TATA, chloroplastic-like [Physcomitrium patens]AAS47587.1 chloroplast Tha4-2 [Physcomitrium patens]PNR49625.1 hypothetical protein PHYPA_011521 [Physcomitrium patens]|eukprot:XP_024383610.1 sec-independent protein translocase protein TATA, chloroplastic-like [Physcomitrella patens]